MYMYALKSQGSSVSHFVSHYALLSFIVELFYVHASSDIVFLVLVDATVVTAPVTFSEETSDFSHLSSKHNVHEIE